MVGREIDPSDIGKHPKLIKAAQYDMSQTDVLVCGNCHNVFHFIELFKEHKDEGCDKESVLRESKETKPKVWAFLLWKASQLTNTDNILNNNSWKMYQTWIKMEESVRETWVVAGKTIQSFAKMGQGNLQEMPVKITKTVVDNAPRSAAAVSTNKYVNRNIDARGMKKDDDDDSKTEPVKVIRKTVGTPINQSTKILANVANSKAINRRAKRTIPNTSGQEFEEETVEKIIAKRFNPRRKMHEYLVKWEDFPHDQNTWEPQTHLECCPQLLETFEKQLARQKEQRAAQAAKQAAALAAAQEQQRQEQQKQQQTAPSPTSPLNRPGRNSKAKALDQVKQWCAEEDNNSISSGTKRKHEDSDYEDNPGGGEDMEDFEEDIIPAHAVKRMKNGNAMAVKVEPKSADVKITTQSQPTIIKAVNGSVRHINDTSAEVLITKENQGSGIHKKTGFSPSHTTSHKSEAQIRVLSKGENTTSGVVRITSTSAQLSSNSVTTKNPTNPSGTTRITQVTQKLMQSNNSTTSGQAQAQISQVQTHRIVMNPREHSGGVKTTVHQQQRGIIPKGSSTIGNTRVMQTQHKPGVVQRTSSSPNVTQQQQQPSPTSGKMIINRGVKSAPTSKNVTPEQKIFQLSKSGDLKVTKKVITHSPQATTQQQQQQQQHQQLQQKQQTKQISQQNKTIQKKESETLQAIGGDEYSSVESPSRSISLCPVTGKVLSHSDAEAAKKDESTAQAQSGVFQTQQAEEQASDDLTNSLALVAAEDGQTQQILANEDGTPLLVTGEDGTIYQVAGKNAEGQTILIAQGADGEQQFAYVAAEDGDEGGVLALDNAVAEAVAQMLPEQQAEALAAAAAAGGETQFIIKQDDGTGNTVVTTADGVTDATQALTIQTGDAGDSQDANIPAEVVQADLPSPGGTRRVVLLLQDGSFMMTEMHDDEYQALNIVT